MDRSTLSSVSDTVCKLWGCELRESQKKAVFEPEEDLLEHQFFIRTICLSAEASVEMHVVEVQDSVGVCSDLVPIATLHPQCQPMVSFSGFELTPPVTFQLRSGGGPLFITGQHVTLALEDEEEEELEARNLFAWMEPRGHLTVSVSVCSNGNWKRRRKGLALFNTLWGSQRSLNHRR